MNSMVLPEQLAASPFSLVLSGGGALGIAHIHVLRFAQQHGLKPQEIIGTSMGAIIGAAYALRYSEQDIYAFIERFSNVFKWGKLSFSQGSLLKTDKIRQLFLSIFGHKRICETPIALKMLATDLNSGEPVLFDSDSEQLIVDAILASMAIPGIFPPVKYDGRYLADGFIASNLPVEYAVNEAILASDVLGKCSFKGFYEQDYKFFGHTRAVLEMVERSVRLMVYNKTREKIHNNRNIFLVEPDVSDFKTYEFHKYREIIRRSQPAAIHSAFY